MLGYAKEEKNKRRERSGYATKESIPWNYGIRTGFSKESG